MLWQVPDIFPNLNVGEVHIWRVPLVGTREDIAELSGLLNQQELERAAKFVVTGIGDRFIMARGMLRKLLAKYLCVDPKGLVFQQNKYGKLYLDFSRLQFNISHSHDLGLFIFALDMPVGVDVEFIREGYKFKDIAQKFFSQDEAAELFALAPEIQEQAFFNCWSRKEAFIKALGVGLFCALDSFSVEVSNSKWGKQRLVYNDNIACINCAKKWSLEALDPADSYVGAMVVGAVEYVVNFYDAKDAG